MATLGDAKNIIVGAAQVFIGSSSLKYVEGSTPANYTFNGQAGGAGLPALNSSASTAWADVMASSGSANWTNVGYTSNGLEIQFQPDFGEVQVDQLLDVARMYKQGMQVNLVTAFAEATLDNLVTAIAASGSDYDDSDADLKTLNLASGNLGEVPLERAICAVGPGSGDPDAVGIDKKERIYVANRALSIESVTVSAKRDAASMFEVTFRLLPASNGSYGKIVDRKVGL